MDAVKFMQEYNKLCKTHNKCKDCPLYKAKCFDPMEGSREESEYSELVEVVERWSKENPEEVGKKYIIEICEAGKEFHYKYRIKGTNILLSESGLADIKKYNEIEEE